MSVHTVTINDIAHVYEQEGSGPALVFFHGGTSSAVWCEHIVPQVLGDYTCYVLEQRGHGRSGRSPTADYSMTALVEDAITFLDTVSGPAIIVGWSQGGAMAMGAAARRRDLVRGIYLEDSVPAIYGQRRRPANAPILAWFAALRALAEAKERDGLSLAQHAYNIGQLAPFGRKMTEVLPSAQLVNFARNAYGTDPAWYAATERPELFWPDAVCDAIPGQVRCPVHVAYGDLSMGSLVRPEDLDDLRATGVRLSATHFPGAGHGIAWPFAQQYIADLKAFLGRVAA